MIVKFGNRKYLIITPSFYSIGDASEQINFAISRSRLLKSKLIIISPYSFTQILKYRICNKALLKKIILGEEDLVDISIKFVATLMINIYFFLRRSIKKIFFFKFIFIKNEEWNFLQIGFRSLWPYAIDSINQILSDPIIDEIHSENFISLTFPIKNFETFLNEHRLGNGHRYICLHVRESGYHGDYGKKVYRNADIDTYNLAIKFLIENGIAVIRMGDSTMKKLSISHPLLIDYARSSYKSEEMDLALIRNCIFYIGMETGIKDTALLFQKPVLSINQYEWFSGYPLKKIDRCIFKKFKINGKELSNIERMDLPFFFSNNMLDFGLEVEMINNTDEEILLAVKNFYTEFINEFKTISEWCDQELKKHYEQRSLILIKELVEQSKIKRPVVPYFHLGRILLRNRCSIGYAYKQL